jgi:flagellar biosynthesis protein FlhA
VLSFLEIPDGKPVEVAAVVGSEQRIGRERIAAGGSAEKLD